MSQCPILKDIISYHVGDVQNLPLSCAIRKMQSFQWRDLVNEESMKRVSASHKPEYRRHGLDMAPWSEDKNRTLDEWSWVPPPRDYFGDDDN